MDPTEDTGININFQNSYEKLIYFDDYNYSIISIVAEITTCLHMYVYKNKDGSGLLRNDNPITYER